jgi:fructokinase
MRAAAGRILVCGEALFDVFCSEPAGSLRLEARAAGSPFNVAVGLARLAQPVAFCGALSSGLLGHRLRAHLEREGVDCSLCPSVDAPTTLSLVETDAEGLPRYTFYGSQGADRLLVDAPALPADIAAIQIGSYPLVVDPIAEALRSLVERERGARVITCDLNVRPMVQPALQHWSRAVDWLAANVQLMKASEEDIALLGFGNDVESVARSWLAAGCELVVITQGADGASAWTRRSRARAPGRPVSVVDTVGAGDAFQSALLFWLAQRGHLAQGTLGALDADALQHALGFAIRGAALACTRLGADPGRLAELEAMAD